MTGSMLAKVKYYPYLEVELNNLLILRDPHKQRCGDGLK